MGSKSEIVVAFLVSAVVTIIIVGTMVIIQGQITAFKVFLDSLTGHHLLTKSVFAAVLFPLLSAVFYFVLKSVKGGKLLKTNSVWIWANILVATVTVLFLAILIDALFHYFAI